jgi:hypothetical protein
MIAILETACGCRKEIEVKDAKPFIILPLYIEWPITRFDERENYAAKTMESWKIQREFRLYDKYRNQHGEIVVLHYRETNPW